MKNPPSLEYAVSEVVALRDKPREIEETRHQHALQHKLDTNTILPKSIRVVINVGAFSLAFLFEDDSRRKKTRERQTKKLNVFLHRGGSRKDPTSHTPASNSGVSEAKEWHVSDCVTAARPSRRRESFVPIVWMRRETAAISRDCPS